MDRQEKARRLTQAANHVYTTQARVRAAQTAANQAVFQSRRDLKSKDFDIQQVANQRLGWLQQHLAELKELEGSPYFVKCQVQFAGESEFRELFFAKFPFDDAHIHSWVAPAATLRFEEPGPVVYERPDGSLERGTLLAKEQYLIVDGQIVFFAAEAIGQPRELIHQAYFSDRKTTFVLPEIIERMEKAQDQVIRADERGSFVIAGPAGSGKTTLAFHRLAYLLRSPETADQFAARDTIVFVQDDNTRAYFSQLLPELGIHDVTVTTFSAWALELLGLKDQFVYRPGGTEVQRDQLEFEKLRALRAFQPRSVRAHSTDRLLANTYEDHLSHGSKRLFREQRQRGELDRFDLTILLLDQQSRGPISRTESYYHWPNDGAPTQRLRQVPVRYSLMLIDEFENYLPEQLHLLNSTLVGAQPAVVYVGDTAQQTQIGAVESITQVEENLRADRRVVLEKVYRSTQPILEYIRSVGYPVEIPAGLRDGEPTREHQADQDTELAAQLRAMVEENPDVQIGILSLTPDGLDEIAGQFRANDRVHVLSVHEAQGVEFDIVCLIGINESLLAFEYELSAEFVPAKKKILKDLLYVALTRAMNQLHVFGSMELQALVRRLTN